VSRIAVVYYSATGSVHALAAALADGAAEAGAEVRLRRVAELAPEAAIAANQRWVDHRAWAEGNVELATLDDLEWASGIALGAPTRFGAPAAQLRQFLDQTGGLWAKGKLADKVVTGFTSASTAHGGLESTILSLLNIAYHWGSVVMPLGYTDPVVFGTGNPYGASWVSVKGSSPEGAALDAARHQGRRLARIAGALVG
jgi:NAD(P)H dehydrogenase (quinone)